MTAKRRSFTAADIDQMTARLKATDCDIAAVAAEFEVSAAYVRRIAQLRCHEIGLAAYSRFGNSGRSE